VTPPQLNVETISNCSQISDLFMATTTPRMERTDSTTDTKSLGDEQKREAKKSPKDEAHGRKGIIDGYI